ncbi:MAG: DUF1653 domain-containing protein [Patescibacteria group bacterium]
MSENTLPPNLKLGTYRHNKSGKLYDVIGIALETESDQAMVVYRPLYAHEFSYELFTRPYDMFVEQVQLNGQMMPRFEKTDD